MGACGTKTAKEEDQLAASREIELELKRMRRDQEKKIKLLLLGTGDSGKSTFAKQMRIMHKGFSRPEYEKHKSILRGNCLSSMQKVLNDCQQRRVPMPDDIADQVDVVLDAHELDVAIAEIIHKAWKSPIIKQEIEDRENALQLPTSVPYFFTHALRFAAPDYMPTDEDIVHARLRTTGITETTFTFEDVEFTIVDVGGQRSERRKWLHCFDAVTAVVYLAALDEYDRTLEEDSKTNRLMESLQLFGDVTGSQWFGQTPFILFLNKSDLFREKIKKKPLNIAFSDVPPEKASDFDYCVGYIQDKFEDTFKGCRLYPYVTCAIDNQNVARVFHTVQDTIITASLSQVGL